MRPVGVRRAAVAIIVQGRGCGAPGALERQAEPLPFLAREGMTGEARRPTPDGDA